MHFFLKIRRKFVNLPNKTLCFKQRLFYQMKSLPNIRIIIYALLVITLPFTAYAQAHAEDQAVMPVKVLNQFEADYSQHKLFLHLDREEYIAGETIWLKAYLVDAATHEPLAGRQRVNLELVNVQNNVVRVAFLRTDNGFASGFLELPDSLPPGNYLVRAYTEWMKNFDHELFFHQEIFIHSPIKTLITNQRQERNNLRFNQQLVELARTMEFGFYPEGGQLVAGLENRVAFKANDGMGKGVMVEGRVLSADGAEITTFSSDLFGMGVFYLEPLPSVEYFARVRFENGSESLVQLPKAVEKGYNVRADILDENLVVRVNRNFDLVSPELLPEVLLLIQSRAKVYFATSGNLTDRTWSVSVPLEVLPTGICQIVLFDGKNMPLSERLVFINHHDINEVAIDVFQLSEQPPSGFEINVNLDFGILHGGSGSFSMAVTSMTGDSRPVPSPSNIASDFMVTSDLTSKVESPWYILSGRTPAERRTMDLIMMTNSWGRFNWHDLVRNKFPEIKFQPTENLTFTGRVLSPDRRALGSGLQVRMRKLGTRPTEISAITDRDGYFVFDNLSFTGSIPVEVSASSFPEARRSEIRLFGITPEKVTFPVTPNTRPQPVAGRTGQRTRGPYVDVSRLSVHRTSRDARNVESSIATPDQIIYIREETVQRFRTVFDVLRTKASGLNMSGGRILLRGPTSIRGSSEPMFGVDGSFTSRDHVFNIRTSDVERIEIFKGPSASIFGVRGAGGVIMVHTRTSIEDFPLRASYTVMGFLPERSFTKTLEKYPEATTLAPEKTLKWSTEIQPEEDGTATLWLRFDNRPENVRIIIQGIDRAGNLFFGERFLTL